jgi:hypothetical protein
MVKEGLVETLKTNTQGACVLWQLSAWRVKDRIKISRSHAALDYT